jgi:hypothetical protein
VLKLSIFILATMLIVSGASAGNYWSVNGQGDRVDMVDLLAKGFEVKAALRDGQTESLILQKGSKVYKCWTQLSATTVELPTNTLNCFEYVKPFKP